jgi:hypothetical protein
MVSLRTWTVRLGMSGLAAAALLAGATAAQAQSVVLRSTGPSAASYPQGKKLPANAKVTLRAGDKLTVLDKAGSRVLSGPGSFTLNGVVARDGGSSPKVGTVLAGGGVRARTGAVRGAPGLAAVAQPATNGPDSVWYIDVSKGGAYCVTEPASLVLWRPNRAEEASGKLGVLGTKPVEITWRKGNPLKQWPVDKVPVVDSTRYTFSDPLGPNVTITLHLVGPVPPADELSVASLLADRGCKAQLDVLANAATASGSAAGG